MVPSVRSLEQLQHPHDQLSGALRGRSGRCGKGLASHLPQHILPAHYLFPSTTPAAADACISAMLSLAVVKSRGPLSADGTDCSTLRSTKGLNGASFWAKRD